MSSLINELDMFERIETSIKSKSEKVHQVYESKCIAIEKQFESQQIVEKGDIDLNGPIEKYILK